MCGIAGSFGAIDLPIEAMIAAMRLRGPDDSGVFCDRGAVLGMTRLAIVDTSSAGHQPMLSEDGGVVLVFNGEIYNHRQLRTELEQSGHRFRSHSDTEVILRLYLQCGRDFVSRLRGMFAIAIYDRRKGAGQEELILLRDHFGIKPLLYASWGDEVVFASDLPTMLSSGRIAADIDQEAVRQLLLRGAVYQPRTILRQVRALMPGHMMVVTRRGQSVSRFWAPGSNRRADIAALSYPDQVDAVRQALHRTVGEQLLADVPVGAFLSGGLDSSLMVALMAGQKVDRIRTYSIGYGQEGSDLDETGDAAYVARHLNVNHRRIEVSGDDVLRELPAFIAGLGQPSVDGLNSYMVSRAAAEDVKVAISGTGGDELFAGYPWYRTMRDMSIEQGGWANLLEQGFLAAGRAGLPHGMMARFAPDGFISHYARQYRHFGPDIAGRMLGLPTAVMAWRDIADLAAADHLANESALNRTTALCLEGYTLNQLLRDIDATSMAHSLEVRVPFLDPEIADIALSLPDQARLGSEDKMAAPGSYRAEGTKRVLLDAAADFLPVDFMSRPKRGFSLPMQHWLNGVLREMLEDHLLATDSAMSGLLDHGVVRQVIGDFMSGKSHWGRPWLLLVLELWCRQFFAAGRAVPQPPVAAYSKVASHA